MCLGVALATTETNVHNDALALRCATTLTTPRTTESTISSNSLTSALFLAYHDGGHGGSGGLGMLLVFLGVVGTGAWLIFSTLKWRNTVLVTLAGWALIAGILWLY